VDIHSGIHFLFWKKRASVMKDKIRYWNDQTVFHIVDEGQSEPENQTIVLHKAGEGQNRVLE
jgi:hypothetical protein